MPDNPYQTPVTDHQAKTDGYTANKAPRALKIICILCITLGALGFFWSLVATERLLMQDQISASQIKVAPPEQRAMQTKMAEAQASFFIPNIFIALCNLLIAPLLMIGSISVLIKKTWGPKILSFALIAATAYALIRSVLISLFQMQIFSIAKDSMTDHIPGGLEAGTVESIILLASLYSGVAFSVGMLLALPVFYFWAWRYLKKDACREYLSTFSA